MDEIVVKELEEVLSEADVADLVLALRLLRAVEHGQVVLRVRRGRLYSLTPSPEFLASDERARGRDWMARMQDALHGGE